jgi:hypothetical protein
MTARIKGVMNPQIGKHARTNNNDPTMPHAVIIGITRGQYTPQNSIDEADTFKFGVLGNLQGRYIVR